MSRYQTRQAWGLRLFWLSLCVGGWILTVQIPMGCTPSGVINKKDFRTDCAANEDCIAVVVNDLCACSCNHAAINKADQEKYNEARQNARNSCGTFGKTCGACVEPDPRTIQCVDKVCVINP